MDITCTLCLFPRTCICSHETDSWQRREEWRQTLFLLPWEESGLRGRSESKCAGQSGPRVPGEPQNQKLQVHRKQFSQSIKKLFLFIHRMMRADRSHLWTNGRLFWRPGWCALWWVMMGWKPSLMNWVSVVFFPSWFHSSFVSNLPSISDIANTVVFPVMHT